MAERIAVKYVGGPIKDLRYLDPETGALFTVPTGGIGVHGPFKPSAPGRWGCRSDIVEALGAMAPVDPAPYPDGNPKSLQGAKKYSLRYLPLPANIAVNQALEDGAKKYGPANWREKGVAASVYVDAALRHLSQYFDGKQNNASDSGVHNLGHAMACLAIIIDAEANGTLTDDRPFPCKDTDALLLRS
uniref:dATP/dGTP diphosphohydrolase N-terminal domain-containing protein n=4 Tax=unclassified bacterial viruses TaxID=12333 RepID=A0AAU6W253_9VIRU